MSDTSTNTGAPAEGSAPSALDDGGLSEFFSSAPSEPSAPVAEGASAQPAPAADPAAQPQQPAPVDPAVPPAPAPAPQAQPTVSPEDLAALRAEIARMNGNNGTPGDGTQPEPVDPLRAVPDYNMQIPVQLVQQFNDPDDNVRAAALSATISAVAKTVHNQVLTQMHANLDALRGEIPQMTTRMVTERQEGEAANRDFYGKYPAYNTPVLRPLVQMAVLHVGQANPQLAQNGWTPEFRDKVGEYLQQNVPLAPAAAPAPAAPKLPGATPPTMMGSGSRPAAPTLDGNAQALAEMFPV